MAFQGKQRRGKSASESAPDATRLTCPDCGASVDRKGLLNPKSHSVFHCEGSKVALGCYMHEQHHSTVLWEPCWKCMGPMGCWLCMPGQVVRGERGLEYGNCELWCFRCRVAANLPTLLRHGPPAGFTMDAGAKQIQFGQLDGFPLLGEYPDHWKRAYYQACVARGIACDESPEMALNAFRKQLADFKINTVSLPSRRKLQRKRNEQVKALQEAQA